MTFIKTDHSLIFQKEGETLQIESWGKESFRVRATRFPSFTNENWALSEDVKPIKVKIKINKEEASITNGNLMATINNYGIVSFYKDDFLILREYYRNYDGTYSDESRCLKYINREYHGIPGGDFKIVQSFESDDAEKFFGFGQYQQSHTNLKGCILDLEQRNSQVSVPFGISSNMYGFLWNNPAIGRVSFGMNKTEWIAEASKELDYWITIGDTPKQILKNYTEVTGRAPSFPDDLLGLWQCKLRYRSQEEVLNVVHECIERNVSIDMIVIDFFHWTYQGDWKFDPKYWPDPKAMIDEIHKYGIKVVVSVWPSVDKRSENFKPMWDQGLLIRTERGVAQTYEYQGDCVEIDATNPKAREYVWNVVKKNYYDLGIDGFWLDNGEPDYTVYDFDNFRYYIGSALETSNIWPQYYSRLFYEPQKELGKKNIVSLLRSCWAGSQKYGNVVWSGDVPSTFQSLRDQLQCGINMGIAGIPWWTSDIGGFMTDDWKDPSFQQLLVRWFEFATFTAVLRMHGDRGPNDDIEPLDNRDWGGGYLYTGHPNEIWSYGKENEKIFRKYLDIRHELKPYLSYLYKQASIDGSPILRSMFYEFPEDEKCWEIYDQYMFGDAYLVAPILYEDTFERDVYLPDGYWEDYYTNKEYTGNQVIHVQAPLDTIPVFHKIY